MIYLDNAATSFQKPACVHKALTEATRRYSANAGHGGHRLAIIASEIIYEASEAVADIFGIEQPENIAFTQNTTLALNMAIKGVLAEGGHAVITSMEHNSVARPVAHIAKRNYTVVGADERGYVRPEDIDKAIRPDTRLIVCNHASNVCGSVQNIEHIGKIASDRGILFLVDAAQSGGVLPIDVRRQHIDLLAFAGHKSLLGPLGTGGLYVRDGVSLSTIIEGGTGSQSESLEQPENMPDRFTSGTMNMPAIAALGAGARFVKKTGLREIYRHEMQLTGRLLEGFCNMDGVRVYGPQSLKNRVGVISINIDGMDCVSAAQLLDERYQIAVRAGLHCAPLAHQTLGTQDSGTIRFSVGYFNTRAQIDRAVEAVYKIKKENNV